MQIYNFLFILILLSFAVIKSKSEQAVEIKEITFTKGQFANRNPKVDQITCTGNECPLKTVKCVYKNNFECSSPEMPLLKTFFSREVNCNVPFGIPPKNKFIAFKSTCYFKYNISYSLWVIGGFVVSILALIGLSIFGVVYMRRRGKM